MALGEAGGTVAGKGTDGVDTEELAVVLPGGTLIQVCGTDGPRGLRAGPGWDWGLPRGKTLEMAPDAMQQGGGEMARDVPGVALGGRDGAHRA